MGLGKSTSNKSSKNKPSGHSDCNCALYAKYKHCCKTQCFYADRKNTKIQLLKALKKYNADYIADVVLSYLPFTFEIFKDENHHNSFLYAPIIKSYAQETVCPIWRENITDQVSTYNRTGAIIATCPGIKCVMYGDGGVGKSALTIRFVTDNFLDEYDPTIEDSYRKKICIGDKAFELDVLDTAGREEFTSMQDMWIRDGKIFILCFAINRRYNFDNISIYRERLLRSKEDDDNDWGMILVGTKCDLEHERQVSTEEAVELAKEWNIPYVETSAKEKINVELLYDLVVYTYWISSVQSVNRE
eukprot:349709_1